MTGNRVRLSSNSTFFWKYIFSGVWLLGFLIGTIVTFLAKGFAGFGPLAGLVLGFALLYYGTLRAKVVSFDDNNLYVSNFFTQAIIPLSDIDYITENRLFAPRLCFIHLKTESKFERTIMFIMRYRIFFSKDHPDIENLKSKLG